MADDKNTDMTDILESSNSKSQSQPQNAQSSDNDTEVVISQPANSQSQQSASISEKKENTNEQKDNKINQTKVSKSATEYYSASSPLGLDTRSSVSNSAALDEFDVDTGESKSGRISMKISKSTAPGTSYKDNVVYGMRYGVSKKVGGTNIRKFNERAARRYSEKIIELHDDAKFASNMYITIYGPEPYDDGKGMKGDVVKNVKIEHDFTDVIGLSMRFEANKASEMSNQDVISDNKSVGSAMDLKSEVIPVDDLSATGFTKLKPEIRSVNTKVRLYRAAQHRGSNIFFDDLEYYKWLKGLKEKAYQSYYPLKVVFEFDNNLHTICRFELSSITHLKYITTETAGSALSPAEKGEINFEKRYGDDTVPKRDSANKRGFSMGIELTGTLALILDSSGKPKKLDLHDKKPKEKTEEEKPLLGSVNPVNSVNPISSMI